MQERMAQPCRSRWMAQCMNWRPGRWADGPACMLRAPMLPGAGRNKAAVHRAGVDMVPQGQPHPLRAVLPEGAAGCLARLHAACRPPALLTWLPPAVAEQAGAAAGVPRQDQ